MLPLLVQVLCQLQAEKDNLLRADKKSTQKNKLIKKAI